jgi:hypothetical protein
MSNKLNIVVARARYLIAEYEAHSVTDGDVFDLFKAIIEADYATPDVKAAIVAWNRRATWEHEPTTCTDCE